MLNDSWVGRNPSKGLVPIGEEVKVKLERAETCSSYAFVPYRYSCVLTDTLCILVYIRPSVMLHDV
jgi:hypothetical protein